MVTLEYGDVFTVEQYRYRRFKFGTDRGYRASYGDPEDWRRDPGTPWAFSLPSILSDTPIQREVPVAHLSFGDLVNVPGYGTYRLARDHNENVKFIAE